jgi:hypothetical protein
MNASGNQLLALEQGQPGPGGFHLQQICRSCSRISARRTRQPAASRASIPGSATPRQPVQHAGAGSANKETGIGNANANADLARYNASGNIWNAIGSLGGMKTAGGGSVGGDAMSGLGSAATSMLAMFSDERLKEDIEPVGQLYDGRQVYKYRYIGSPAFQIGLMAQDEEKIAPDNVVEIGGYKAVNYRL